ncbi:hypothetical protein RJ035_005175, partial [Blastomyces gilchristii]
MAELAEAGLDGGFGAQFRSTANLQPVTLASELALSINISIYHPSQVVNPGA